MARLFFQCFFVVCFLVISLEYTMAASTKIDPLDTVRAEGSVYLKSCKKELNSTKEDIENLSIDKPGVNVSRGTKCLRACIGEKLKVIDSDGKLIKDAVEQLFVKSVGKHYKGPKGWVADVAEKCNEKAVKGDKCETVSNVTDCVVNAMIEKVKSFKDD